MRATQARAMLSHVITHVSYAALRIPTAGSSADLPLAMMATGPGMVSVPVSGAVLHSTRKLPRMKSDEFRLIQ